MRNSALCMPIYLLGSLQYFADTRSANGDARKPAPDAEPNREFATELSGIVASINAHGEGNRP